MLFLLALAFSASAKDMKPKLRGLDTVGKEPFDADDKKPPAGGKPVPSPRPAPAPAPAAGPDFDVAPPAAFDRDFVPDLDDPVRALTCAKIGNEPWHEAGNPQHDCFWLEAALIRNPSLCALQDDDGIRAYERCKITCRVCGRTCDDSPDFRTVDEPYTDSLGIPWVGAVGGGGRDCAWVGKNAKERCRSVEISVSRPLRFEAYRAPFDSNSSTRVEG